MDVFIEGTRIRFLCPDVAALNTVSRADDLVVELLYRTFTNIVSVYIGRGCSDCLRRGLRWLI